MNKLLDLYLPQFISGKFDNPNQLVPYPINILINKKMNYDLQNIVEVSTNCLQFISSDDAQNSDFVKHKNWNVEFLLIWMNTE